MTLIATDFSGTTGSIHLAHLPVVSGMVELTHLGVIRVTGEDSVKFLQGQLTQDVALLKPDEARLAAFCNAKGRMQASFVMFRRDANLANSANSANSAEWGHEIILVCSRDILAQTLKRLSMFVMRAKAKLTDATEDFKLFGIVGNAVESIGGSIFPSWTNASIPNAANASLITLPSANHQPRALWCAPVDSTQPKAPVIDLALWQWLDVQAGIALITQPIFEAFVPQMLNYESVGGVSFKKGCYPGQEIVARSQFRGTLKRRAYLVHGDSPVAPSVGVEVFHISDAEQPCGLVAASAINPMGGFDAIVSMQTFAAAEATQPGTQLTLASATGTALTLLTLPYPLLEDI